MVTVSALPILRLIERTVRSGATTHWLRAGVPTSTSPSGAMPTTDGSKRSPLTGSSTGAPSSMTASTELVVPRSMPMILSDWFMVSCLSDDHVLPELIFGQAVPARSRPSRLWARPLQRRPRD